MEKLEKTQEKNIFYKPETDTYVVSLDFGFVEKLNKKTGQYEKKRKKVRRTAKTFKEAKIIKREFEEAKSQGQKRLDGRYSTTTLLEACEDYLNHNLAVWSPSYMTRQRVHVHRLVAYVTDSGIRNKPVREYTATDIERIYLWSLSEHTVTVPAEQGTEEKQIEIIGRTTLEKLHSFLRGLFLYCSKDFPRYGVTVSPVTAAVIPLKKSHYEPGTYSQEEMRGLLQYALNVELKEHAGASLTLLVLAGLCGLRRGELCALRWSDLDTVTERIHVVRQRQRVQVEPGEPWVEEVSTPKGGQDEASSPADRKERWAALPSVCYRLLMIVKQEQERYRPIKDNDFIYQDSKSLLSVVPPNSKTVTKRWQQFLTRYRKRTQQEIESIRLHDLRHTNARLLRDGECDIFSIAYHLGHTIPGMVTARYLHDDGFYGRDKIREVIDELFGDMV